MRKTFKKVASAVADCKRSNPSIINSIDRPISYESEHFSFIEEFANGNKSKAIYSLVQKSRYVSLLPEDFADDEIYKELASQEWASYLKETLQGELLSFDSIA